MFRILFGKLLVYFCAAGLVWKLGFLPPSESAIFAALPEGKLLAGSPNSKKIALTFDDGPSPVGTIRLLDLLKKEGVHATFFLVGKMCAAYPELVKRIDAEGHEIGNHSYNHVDLSKISGEQISEEWRATSDLIEKLIGKRPEFCRPPGGESDGLVLEKARENGMVMVFWTVNTGDYSKDSPDPIIHNALTRSHPGAIVLMHTNAAQTVIALPEIIRQLRSEGYSFVTVKEMLEDLENQKR